MLINMKQMLEIAKNKALQLVRTTFQIMNYFKR